MIQLSDNETKKLEYISDFNAALAGEVILFQVNVNLSSKQREYFIKKLIQRWNSHDKLLEACKGLINTLSQNDQKSIMLTKDLEAVFKAQQAIKQAESEE